MPKTRTVKNPVQKGRITIGDARSAAKTAKHYRSAPSGATMNLQQKSSKREK